MVNIDAPELIHYLRQASQYRTLTFGLASDADLRITGVCGTISRTSFCLDRVYRVELIMPGVHHATNAAAAFAVAREFNVPGEQVADRLRSFTPPEGRTQLYKCGEVTLIDDTYNANPASMAAAIVTLEQESSGRRVLVMGDMLELGRASAAMHRRAVGAVCQSGIEVLITVGSEMAKAAEGFKAVRDGPHVVNCDDAEAAGEALVKILSPGDTVWIKASRAMRLERVVSRVVAEYEPQALACADVRAG